MLREENLCCLEEMLHVSKSVLTTNICFKQTLLVYFLQKVAHLLTQRALTAAPPSWNEGTTKGRTTLAYFLPLQDLNHFAS